MKKIIVSVIAGLILSGCITNAFDSTEYEYLVLTNLLAETPGCDNRALMQNHTRFLAKYSQHRLNTNIHEIYRELDYLAQELAARSKPSEMYCTVKKRTIYKLTEEALDVYGNRK